MKSIRIERDVVLDRDVGIHMPGEQMLAVHGPAIVKMPNRVSTSPGVRRRPRLTFRQYLQLRLGNRGGGSAWFNFFIKPFAA
jgi:hypothetical protein